MLSIIIPAFADSAKLKTATAEALGNDVLATHWAAYRKALSAYQPAVERYEKKVAELNRIYVRGLCEMYDWAKSPDANSTLRMTYGHVKGYAPRDAVRYDWKTTLRGMFEKENPADPDYVVDEKLRQHYLTKKLWSVCQRRRRIAHLLPEQQRHHRR